MSPSDQKPTPPHHPTHNVRFSPETIRKVLSMACPGHKVLKIETLGSGMSFNNRIYFVNVSFGDDHDPDERDRDGRHGVQQSLVLKVSGQYFGPDKVQNEVSCLMLIERHCPDIPAPRVIAWSEGKLVIRRPSESANAQKLMPVSVDGSQCTVSSESDGRGWVLMTRQPGRLIGLRDLQGPEGTSLMRELAGYVAQWRLKLPKADRIGNIKHVPVLSRVKPGTVYNSLEDDLLQVMIKGLLLCHHIPPEIITTSFDYYRVKLEDQLAKLETEDIFSATRKQIAPLIRDFIKNSLPGLSLFASARSAAITFAHYDFSPRNILVSEKSPHLVTGILDFEFGGFFPSEEEFTNNAITNADDWPEPAYRIFLAELEKLGVRTPLQGIDRRSWTEACALVEITGNVAPWYLREGGLEGQELEEELSKAAESIKRAISELEVQTMNLDHRSLRG